MPKLTLSKSSKCPCGSALKYAKCCGRYLKPCQHTKPTTKPLTAEALMRSRYSAYVLGDEGYLLKTWHDSTRPVALNLAQDTSEWIKLELLKVQAGKPKDNKGSVEFIAYFKTQNQRQQLQEISRFIKEDGQWFYLDGQTTVE